MVTKPTAISTLERNLDILIEDEIWQSLFKRKGYYTKNRFFRIWQFKILHGIHNTGKNLKNGKLQILISVNSV